MLVELAGLMGTEQVVILDQVHRYAIEVQVDSASPPEALFLASARLSDALRRLGFTGWSLQRAEVLSREEYERYGGLCPEANSARAAPAPVVDGYDLLRRVFHDSLTGLPTLAFFRDRAQGIISRGAVSGGQLALAVVDIDDLGRINDELGYVFGDGVLVALSRRLMGLADPAGALARLTGDEFVLLLDDADGAAEARAQQILAVLREPIEVASRALVVTASIGLVPVRFDSDLDECLRRAGSAMAAAKEAGGHCVRWYQVGLTADPGRLDFIDHFVPDRLAYIMLLERTALAANECASLEEAAGVVLHQVLAHTGWRAGRLWRVAERAAGIVLTDVWHGTGPDRARPRPCDDEPPLLAAGEGLPGRALISARPVWAPVTAATGAGAWGSGAAAAVAFPVLAGREVVAVLEFCSARPIVPDDSLLEVMAAVGAQLGRISERTRAADALARSEERYRVLADSLPALIWAAGADARCTFVNRGWLDFTGRTIDDELGDGWAQGVHPDDLGTSLRAYLPAFVRRRPFQIEFRMRRHDGQFRWLLSQGAPLFDDGQFAGFVGSCIDITDRRQAEKQARVQQSRFRSVIAAADVRIVVDAGDGRVAGTSGEIPGARED